MPKTITTTVYDYKELEARPKERARDWYRSVIDQSSWHIPVFKEFVKILNIINIDASLESLGYCGFSYQGNGASFTGYYTFKPTIADDIKQAYPLELRLWANANRLTKIQKIYNNQITCKITRDRCGEHEYAMDFEFRMANGSDLEKFDKNHHDEFIVLMREIARYFYDTLESKYNKITSKNEIDRKLRFSDFSFTENGERFS